MLATNRKREVNLYHSENLWLQMHHQHQRLSHPSLLGDGELQELSPATSQKDQHTHFKKVIEQKNSFYHLALPLEKMAPGALNCMINVPPPDLYCPCKSQD